MSIRCWPATERPRERLLAKSAEQLSDTELLAILLSTGSRGQSAMDHARQLLQYYGGIRQLLSAPFKDFSQHPGMGLAKYCQLQASLELARRHLQETLQRCSQPLQNPEAVEAFLKASLRDADHEIFACLFLDNKHRVICFEKLFHGNLSSAHVHPGEVVKRALHHNAAALIIAHNHPSGHPEPSEADRHLTQQLSEAIKLVDIRLLDHIIIGDGKVTSFARAGLIPLVC